MGYNTSQETASKKELLDKIKKKEYLFNYIENDVLKFAFTDFVVLVDLQLRIMYRYGNNIRENYLLSNLENRKLKCIYFVS